MIESAEDRRAFMDVDVFGVEVTLNPGASESTFTAIFDNEYFSVDTGEHKYTTSEPTLLIVDDDAPAIQQGDTVRIQSKNYTVREPQPDGTGITVLALNRS